MNLGFRCSGCKVWWVADFGAHMSTPSGRSPPRSLFDVISQDLVSGKHGILVLDAYKIDASTEDQTCRNQSLV